MGNTYLSSKLENTDTQDKSILSMTVNMYIDVVRRTISNEVSNIISKCLTYDSSKIFLIEDMGILDLIICNAQMGHRRGLGNDRNHCRALLECLHVCTKAMLALVTGQTHFATCQRINSIYSKLEKSKLNWETKSTIE